jgi:hypothetical protein
MSNNCCPHCGHDEYFVRTAMRGTTDYYHRFDGAKGAYNGHIHDGLNYVEGKVRYCGQCKKRVGKNPAGDKVAAVGAACQEGGDK